MVLLKTLEFTQVGIFMEEQRGSEKLLQQLFGAEGNVSHESLSEALKAAREEFMLRRWIVIGQPAPDQISATIDVEVGRAGTVLQQIINLQNPQLGIKCYVFPMGQPKPDLVQVQVDAQINLRR